MQDIPKIGESLHRGCPVQENPYIGDALYRRIPIQKNPRIGESLIAMFLKHVLRNP